MCVAQVVCAQEGPIPSPRSISTYESIGIYWRITLGSAEANNSECRLEFRAKGTLKWNEGLPLWYDQRNSEFRGSLVHLQPGTSYEIKLSVSSGISQTFEASTWPDKRPVGQIIELPAISHRTLWITESGRSDGYILYMSPPGQTAMIDTQNKDDFNVVVNAKYIIVRGLRLKGARHSGILLGPAFTENSSDVTDVIIEDNDISEWGTDEPSCAGKAFVHGTNLQAAIYSHSTKVERITIQRNKLHDPSTGANSWYEENCAGSRHPQGPQGISIRKGLGNLVIRYNEIYSRTNHYFNDGMGDVDNFSDAGFPNRDSDIYGNFIANSWDDGIEAEGADENVRIWGNYLDQIMIPFGLAPVYRGPIYIWRNISHVSRSGPDRPYGQSFIKARNMTGSDMMSFGGGRVYLFNNTSLSPHTGSSTKDFIREYDWKNRLMNYRTLNNIMHVSNSLRNYSIKDEFGSDSLFDFDLLVGRTAFSQVPQPQEVHGVKGAPIYTSGWGFDGATRTGRFSLAPGSPGYDQGTVIPNFTNIFTGSAPDMGAHEAGMPPMEFGVAAQRR
jgi:hypothetical protein